MNNTEERYEFVDRYTVLGIPDPERMCRGRCEGTGYVPVFVQQGDSKNVYVTDEDDPALVAAWHVEHAKAHRPWTRIRMAWAFRSPRILWEKCDGWHFVVCPECNGTRLREPTP